MSRNSGPQSDSHAAYAFNNGHAVHVDNGEPPRESSKKRRAPNVRMSYPRKRAVTACQLCRMRKQKCDNQRPSCSTCVSIDVVCNYQDRTSGDLSSFDPASLAILDRVNTAIQLLQNQAHLSALVENLAALTQSRSPLLANESPVAHSISTVYPVSLPSDAFSPTQLPIESDTTLDEALHGPGSCHDPLDWPIFKGTFPSADLSASFFAQDDGNQVRQRQGAGSKGIREEDAPMLVEYFLQHVHIKNPVLDPPSVIAMAKDVAEEGFKWDGTSCLILVICGLANLAKPFSRLRPSPGDSSIDDARNYSTAEAYYTAARKRIGLLDNSVLAVHATFFLGIYQMYSLRPLQAWTSFHQACLLFQTYLHSPRRQEADRATRRLEQRLYWSCLKSECEMRDEVDTLPPSGLARVNHPDVFPSPPGGTPEPEAGTPADQSPNAQRGVDADVQKSWFYYLSEIACRRLKNRISKLLHSGSPLSWQLASLPKLFRLAEELSGQVNRWAEHIPGFLDSIDEDTTDELTMVLMARYHDMQELIYRPFLYLVIEAESLQGLSPIALRYAERCVNLELKQLYLMNTKHRHHGSWMACRQGFTRALLLVAAVRSERISIPEHCAETLWNSVTMLSYWEVEAPDLGVARRILSSLCESTAGLF